MNLHFSLLYLFVCATVLPNPMLHLQHMLPPLNLNTLTNKNKEKTIEGGILKMDERMN